MSPNWTVFGPEVNPGTDKGGFLSEVNGLTLEVLGTPLDEVGEVTFPRTDEGSATDET